MFQSLKYTKDLGYDEKTKLNSYEYNLTDSDFGCVTGAVGFPAAVGFLGAVGVAVEVEIGVEFAPEVGIVIQEYSKRNLNVAYNLLLYFRWIEEEYSIAEQIEWAEKFQPLFTPQIKADIQKYLLLL